MRPLLLAVPLLVACGGADPGHPTSEAQAATEPDWPDRHAEYDAALGDTPEYRAIQKRLATGWNTWDSRSVLRWVLLPEGLAVDLALKRHDFLEEGYLAEALIGRSGEHAERVRPGARAVDGSWGELHVEWQGLAARVEFGRRGENLVVLVEPAPDPPYPYELVVSAGPVWNHPGTVEATPDGFRASLPSGEQRIQVVGTAETDPYAGRLAPYRVVRLDEPVWIATGDAPASPADLQEALDRSRATLETRAAAFGGLAEAWTAVTSVLAWNTIYEPRHQRVVSTVGRLWNREYGGVALFGWDNFFLAWLAGLESRDLALANAIEHLRGHTPEGFLPNDNRGNGSKSWDRSQPPVGGILVREVIRRYPERWFEEAAFEALLAWNRWWPPARDNGGLLAYGSHAARNPFDEPVVRTKTAAGYESGMDDSSMYEDVPFHRERGTLELQDVGLTSLYVADCRALAEIARRLGRPTEAEELEARGDRYAEALNRLWVEERGIYLNYRTDLERFSERRSPTLLEGRDALLPAPRRDPVNGPRRTNAPRAPARPRRVLGRIRAPVHRPRRPVVPAPALLEGRDLAAAELPHLPRPPRRRRTGSRRRACLEIARHVPLGVATEGLCQRELLLDHWRRRRRTPLERPVPQLGRALRRDGVPRRGLPRRTGTAPPFPRLKPVHRSR